MSNASSARRFSPVTCSESSEATACEIKAIGCGDEVLKVYET